MHSSVSATARIAGIVSMSLTPVATLSRSFGNWNA